MPASVEPMRPILAAKPFSDRDWLFEPKWDGWRTLCFVRDGKVHLVSRRKNSLNERFPDLREIGKAIKANAALIDGEIVALGEDGLPQFDALRFRRGRKCSLPLRNSLFNNKDIQELLKRVEISRTGMMSSCACSSTDDASAAGLFALSDGSPRTINLRSSNGCFALAEDPFRGK